MSKVYIYAGGDQWFRVFLEVDYRKVYSVVNSLRKKCPELKLGAIGAPNKKLLLLSTGTVLKSKIVNNEEDFIKELTNMGCG